MKIFVAVKPNSRQESVEIQEDGSYVVKVNAPPTEGRANERVIELLAKALDLSKSQLTLISGHKGKRKTFRVD
jgi:uncharacterized protein (TIGR00251 family)